MIAAVMARVGASAADVKYFDYVPLAAGWLLLAGAVTFFASAFVLWQRV